MPKDTIIGDFDGDGLKEYAWLVKPQVNGKDMNCTGDCDCYIRFSNPAIPSIGLKQCIGGHPVNHADMNGSAGDELGVLPEWFTSCWKSYYVYTLHNGMWILAVDPIPTHCEQWEKGMKPIEIDRKEKGHVLIHYSETIGGKIATKKKSVKIR